jgi:glutathione synthase
MKVAVQMDPLEKINLEEDTTICLIKEALSQGFECWYYTADKLYLTCGQVLALASKLSIKNGKILFRSAEKINLASTDVVLMRQNPPMDMDYLTSTYILEKIHPKTFVINNPTEVRNLPEKLFICNYPDFMPPTLVAKDWKIAEEFFTEHKDIVIKPLYAFGGQDVSRITLGEISSAEFKQFFKDVSARHASPVMLQKFLPEVEMGDKRVLLVNGEIAGVINRIPAQGDIRANMCIGGKPTKTILTARDLEMCRILGVELKKRGIILAGLDIIGRYVTEINITSPTGIKAINELYDLVGRDRVEYKFWESVTRIATTKDIFVEMRY